MGIGETLRQALAKIILIAAGDQAKMACGKFQMCEGLEAIIEEVYYAVGERMRERGKAGDVDLCNREEEDGNSYERGKGGTGEEGGARSDGEYGGASLGGIEANLAAVMGMEL